MISKLLLISQLLLLHTPTALRMEHGMLGSALILLRLPFLKLMFFDLNLSMATLKIEVSSQSSLHQMNQATRTLSILRWITSGMASTQVSIV